MCLTDNINRFRSIKWSLILLISGNKLEKSKIVVILIDWNNNQGNVREESFH